MPTYGYRCEKNGHEFEVVQGINDPPLTRCKVCSSKVRRIFYPVGIVFKGSGFYKTDSRSSASITASDGDKSSSDSSDKSASDKSASDKGASDKGASDKGASDKGSSDKGSGKGGEKTATVKKAESKSSQGDSTSKKSA